MTIKVSKPAINLREKLNELEQDTGLKGQELMRANTVAEARTAIGAGRKNLIINGGFDVWQRGTSFTGPDWTADRWRMSTSNTTMTTTKTANRDTYNTLRITLAGASCNLDQRIEAFGNVAYNKQVTVSFWVRGSGSFDNYTCRMRNHTTATNLEDVNYNITTSWVRVTKTFTASTSWAKDDVCRFYLLTSDSSMASGDWIEFSNVQLELGSVATEFEHRSYGEELALCQRYFYTPTPAGTTHHYISPLVATGSTTAFGIINYPVPMRAAPSLDITISGGTYRYRANLGSNNGNSVSTNPVLGGTQNNTLSGRLQWDSGFSGLTTDNSGWVTNGDGGSGYFGLNAEL